MTWTEFTQLLQTLHPVSIFFRLLLSTLCGGVLGSNRARKHRPAGFRTHMLVCLGATIVMLTSQFALETYGVGDPTRMGAQVISGIGFLGAGTIVVNRRNQVLGLTTAAGLWANACIGLAIGIGFYSGALMGTLFLIVIVVVFNNMDQWLQSTSKELPLYVEFTTPAILSELLSYLTTNSVQVKNIEIIEARNHKENIAAILQLQLPKRNLHEALLEHMQALDGIVYVDRL